MGCLLGILTIFCSMLEALFKKFPDLAESFFKNIPGFLNFYEQMQGLLFEDKLN